MNDRKVYRSYSMSKDDIKKIEDLYITRVNNRQKSSRSGVVGEAVHKLWQSENSGKEKNES